MCPGFVWTAIPRHMASRLFPICCAALSLFSARAEEAPASAAKPGSSIPEAKPDAPVTPAKPGEKEISDAEIDALIARLSQIRGGLDSEMRKAIAEALKALGTAVGDNTQAVNLFVSSSKIVDFERQDKPSGDFETWRKQNDDKLHDAAFGTALRLQYRYLKLRLECDTAEKAEAAFPAIVALQEEVIRALPSCGAHAGLLREDVSGNVVSRRFAVTKIKPQGWPGGALDLEGHFRRALSLAIESSPASVSSLWETRLKLERALAEAWDKNATILKRKKNPPLMGRRVHNGRSDSKNDTDGDETKSVVDFETTRLPRLQWAMAEDFHKCGRRRAGFEAMYSVIMKYPKHPDVQVWVDRITELAKSVKEARPSES